MKKILCGFLMFFIFNSLIFSGDILFEEDKIDYTLQTDNITNVLNITSPNSTLDLKEEYRYYNPVLEYSIIFPESWDIVETNENVNCIAYIGEQSNTIIFAIAPSVISPEDKLRFEDLNVEEMKDILNYSAMSPFNPTNAITGETQINTLNIKWMSCSVIVENEEFICRYYCFVENDCIYIIGCFAKPVVFELFIEQCEEILETFRYEGSYEIGETSTYNQFDVVAETLWVQSGNTWSGTLLGWNEDLSMWVASITRGNLSNMESAVFTENFISEWFPGGIISCGVGILYDGTPLYYGSKFNQVYVGVGEQLIGPYSAGTRPFVVSEDRMHWAKVIGKEDRCFLLYDGEEVSEIYDKIWPVLIDPSSGNLFYRFKEGNLYGVARADSGVLFESEWIGNNIVIDGDDVYCEIGKDGVWRGGYWYGLEAVVKNGDVLFGWWEVLEFFDIKKDVPFYFFEDQGECWCGLGSEHYGPYEILNYPVSGFNDDIFYVAGDMVEGFSVYKNGECITDEKYIMVAIFPDDSILGRSPGTCPYGVGYVAVDEKNDYYVIFNKKKYGPYQLATPPVVSEDGEHLAWVIKNQNGKAVVVLDGNPQLYSFNDIHLASIKFSSNGQHLAYLGKTNAGEQLVLDDILISKPFANPALTEIGVTYSDIYLSDEKLCILGNYLDNIHGVSLVRIIVRFE